MERGVRRRGQPDRIKEGRDYVCSWAVPITPGPCDAAGCKGPGSVNPAFSSVRLIAVGRLRAGPEADLFGRYAARLRPRLDVREVAEATGIPSEIRKKESAALLAAVTPQDSVIALDLGGAALTSEAFANLLQDITEKGRKPAFLIGGAEGMAESLTARADHVLSLGTLTWPHMLVRVMLAEQLYRAQCIASGHPYHRGFRP